MIKYTCAICEGEFVSEWSMEEANEEFETMFGSKVDEQQTDLICDDCYCKYMDLRIEGSL